MGFHVALFDMPQEVCINEISTIQEFLPAASRFPFPVQQPVDAGSCLRGALPHWVRHRHPVVRNFKEHNWVLLIRSYLAEKRAGKAMRLLLGIFYLEKSKASLIQKSSN